MTNWNLEKVFKTLDDAKSALEVLKNDTNEFASFKGKLNTKEGLVSFFEKEEAYEKKLSTLYSYASMRFDLNQADLSSQQLLSSLQNVLTNYSVLTSFVSDELLKNKYSLYEEYAKDEEIIKNNLFRLKKIFDQKKYVLKPKLEEILANYSPITRSFAKTYGLLEAADMKPITIKLTNGEEVTFTKNNYTTLLSQTKSQEDRRLIFEAFFKHYDDLKNTYANLYKGVIDSNIAMMKSRGYKNILDLFLDRNKISKNVYLSLVNTARKNSKPLKRYIKLRKKIFKLKEYHTYDRFLTFANDDTKYSYEDAKKVVFEALAPRGEDFINHAKHALEDGRVDVYPKDGKRSGAYSTEIEGFGPYILLNHTDTLDSVFTLIHECGHSIHTLYSSETQAFQTKDYTIFVAEIASTFNEQCLLDYLLKNSDNKNLKIQALEQQIDGIVSTFYRQALFADFELEAHKKALEGNGITYADLNGIMERLYKEYYGIDLSTEELKKYVWAYIPHLFNSPFYVYQYATSLSASTLIFENVKTNKPQAFENYINMLKAGGSMYPVDIVKIAGVDLTTPAPFKALCDKLDYLVDELEKLL